jgi:hypothetical protein
MHMEEANRRLAAALHLLARGELQQGFAEYEARLYAGHFPALDLLGVPMWRGESLVGKSIIVRSEQGYGDTLQFARYIPLLAGRGARVLFAVRPPLARLLRGLAGVAEILPERADAVPPADFHTPLMSLPYRFGTSLETVPANVPYLSAPESISATLKRSAETRIAIGVVWACNAEHPDYDKRSMPVAELSALAEISGTAIYSLQYGEAARDADGISAIRQLGHTLVDFAQTASALTQFDLVVTVDTAIAHLAGAMARRCFLLLPHEADWRWLRDREDSPWYPTLRLFRQPAPGDWAGVMRRVIAAI